MGILVWIVLGAIAGFVAQAVVGGGYGVIGTILLGIVGAVVGGYLARALNVGTVDGLDLNSILIAIVGAVIVILVARAVSGRRGRRTRL